MQVLDEIARRPHLDAGLRMQLTVFAALCCADDSVLKAAAARARDAADDVAQFQTELREICVQGIAYCGFPRALHALFVLAPILTSTSDSDVREAERNDVRARGAAHFESIYAGSADKLRGKIASVDPVFEDLVVDVAYGRILSRGGLATRSRELFGVAGLSVLGHSAQMLSHAFGARRHGATLEAVLESVETVAIVWPESGAAEHREYLSGALGE